jgi:hypothetical protein
MVAHLGQVVELLAELHVLFAVGDVAPRGDIAVVDHHPVVSRAADVAGMAQIGEIMGATSTAAASTGSRRRCSPFARARPCGGSPAPGRCEGDLVHRATCIPAGRGCRALFGQEPPTSPSRRRTELMFQVARVKGMENQQGGAGKLTRMGRARIDLAQPSRQKKAGQEARPGPTGRMPRHNPDATRGTCCTTCACVER